jgi:hypothetical protein
MTNGWVKFGVFVEAFANRGQWPELMAELTGVVTELSGLVENAKR